MDHKFDTKTEAWLSKVADRNGCTREDVIKYLDALSSGRKVIHHLVLA